MEILLEQRNVTSNSLDKAGRTPPSWAARNGYGGIVKILLQHGDASPDTTDKTVEPLSGGQLSIRIVAFWKSFWKRKMIPTLQIKVVEHLFLGQFKMGNNTL